MDKAKEEHGKDIKALKALKDWKADALKQEENYKRQLAENERNIGRKDSTIASLDTAIQVITEEKLQAERRRGISELRERRLRERVNNVWN
jgi:hypothetical protein